MAPIQREAGGRTRYLRAKAVVYSTIGIGIGVAGGAAALVTDAPKAAAFLWGMTALMSGMALLAHRTGRERSEQGVERRSTGPDGSRRGGEGERSARAPWWQLALGVGLVVAVIGFRVVFDILR